MDLGPLSKIIKNSKERYIKSLQIVILMSFHNRLECILEGIGHFKGGREIVRFRDNARNFSHYRARVYFDPVLEKLFEKEFKFSEGKEDKMRVTSEELLSNSFSACKEKDDLFVEYIVYFGTGGIAIHIKDEGPGFDFETEIRKRENNLNGLTDDLVLYGRGNWDYPGGTAIYCLLNFVQDFQYNEKGNEVVVRFDL